MYFPQATSRSLLPSHNLQDSIRLLSQINLKSNLVHNLVSQVIKHFCENTLAPPPDASARSQFNMNWGMNWLN
jgi:hypothetical protein